MFLVTNYYTIFNEKTSKENKKFGNTNGQKLFLIEQKQDQMNLDL